MKLFASFERFIYEGFFKNGFTMCYTHNFLAINLAVITIEVVFAVDKIKLQIIMEAIL